MRGSGNDDVPRPRKRGTVGGENHEIERSADGCPLRSVESQVVIFERAKKRTAGPHLAHSPQCAEAREPGAAMRGGDRNHGRDASGFSVLAKVAAGNEAAHAESDDRERGVASESRLDIAVNLPREFFEGNGAVVGLELHHQRLEARVAKCGVQSAQRTERVPDSVNEDHPLGFRGDDRGAQRDGGRSGPGGTGQVSNAGSEAFHLDDRMSFGVIFDWDGVVVDSSAQHERAWELLAAERNLPLPDGHFKRGFGKKNEVIIPDLGWATEAAAVAELAARKEALYRERVRADGIVALPGVRELLTSLRDAGVPCAVGSSTPRENLDALFEMLRLDGFFAAVVSGDDVTHGKPAPDIFLLAAERIGLSPERCVVIEDAFVGIEAAHAGGMKCVAVATTNPLDALGAADLAVRSLEELDAKRLRVVIDG